MAERMPFPIAVMTEAEIREIAEYLADLEEGLYQWEYRDEAAEYHLGQIRQVVKHLVDASSNSTSQMEQQLFAKLQLKAHRCKESIEERLAVWN